MNTRENDEIEIDLMELIHVVKSKLWILVLTGFLMAAGAFTISKFVLTPQYQSTSQLYMVNKSQSLTSLSLSDLQLGSQLTKDYMILVKSRPVSDQVIQNLGLDMTHEELLSIMTVTNPTDTRILQITIEYPDAYIAKQIVDEVTSVSSKQMAVIMDMKEPSVVEEGYVAKHPSSPHTKRNTLIAGILGVLGAMVVVCILYLLDDTIKSSEDVTKYLELTTLGVIPIEGGKQEGKKKRKTKKNLKAGGAN